jgi:cardiolipin synthase A/B
MGNPDHRKAKAEETVMNIIHRHFRLLSLLFILVCLLNLTACGGDGGSWNPDPPRLVIQPDDGRGPILEAIAAARNNIRLTIYQITDLDSVSQVPAAPPDSIVAALISKAVSGVSVHIVVDQNQYDSASNTGTMIRSTVSALRDAGAVVHLSSYAFCVTHQKTFIIDGPASGYSGVGGTAIIMTFNLVPGYFRTTRDYGVITQDPSVVEEASRVFDSDFSTVYTGTACSPRLAAIGTFPPPYPSDTPNVIDGNLLWSPVNSKSKLLQLINSATQSLLLTTEIMEDKDMVCAIKAVAELPTQPSVRILLSGDTGSNGSAVKTLLELGLTNLSIRVMPGQPPAVPATPLYMHGKQVIADGVRAFVGSENLTNTSLIQNRELGTFFSDPGMIARLQSIFTIDFASSTNSVAATICTGTGQTCSTMTCP